MPRCFLPSCDTKWNSEQKISLHRFPQDKTRRELWYRWCGLSSQNGPKTPFLCTVHFKEEDFVPGRSRQCLIPNAVPSLRREKSDQKTKPLPSTRAPLKSIQRSHVPQSGYENTVRLRNENMSRHANLNSSLKENRPNSLNSLPDDAENTEIASTLQSPPKKKPKDQTSLLMSSPPPLVASSNSSSVKLRSLPINDQHELKKGSSVSSPPPLLKIRPMSGVHYLPPSSPIKGVIQTNFSHKLVKGRSQCDEEGVTCAKKMSILAPKKLEYFPVKVIASPSKPKELVSVGTACKIIDVNSNVVLKGLEISSSLMKTVNNGCEKESIQSELEKTSLKDFSGGKENANLKKENFALREELAKMRALLVQKDKKIKSLRSHIRRLKHALKKVLLRKEVISELDSKDSILKIHKSATDDALIAMLKRMGNKKQGPIDDPSLRSFALTLHFYSPKAYNYIRTKFNNALPHTSTLRRWYTVVDGNPGFTKESFDVLKALSAEKSRLLPVSVMLDDMSLRKKRDMVNDEVIGYVDLGPDTKELLEPKRQKKIKGKENGGETQNDDDESKSLATDVCVFMVVCLDLSVKIPVAYFLHNKLTGRQQACLIRRCIADLYDVGVVVKAVVSDGAPSNKTMAKYLGADIEPIQVGSKKTFDKMASVLPPKVMKPYFEHPSDKAVRVFVMMDISHMLKLVRNALAGRKVLKDFKGNYVSWHDLEALHRLQNIEGLRLGNKLATRHIKWYQNKMKVSVAAQTLSRSVAVSIRFCELLGFKQFEGASSTADFLLIFNDLFDVLNSCSRFASGLKQALTLENEPLWSDVFQRAKKYIHGLKIKDPNEKGFHSVLISKRRTAFQGLLVGIESVRGLFHDLVRSGQMEYLCIYKLSQDHLESFLGVFARGQGVIIVHLHLCFALRTNVCC